MFPVVPNLEPRYKFVKAGILAGIVPIITPSCKIPFKYTFAAPGLYVNAT